MKKYFYFILFVFFFSCNETEKESTTPQMKTPKVAIALHGGAGNLKKLKLTKEEEEAYTHFMDSLIESGHQALLNGAKSIDVVATIVSAMEDSPLFNAGKGAVFAHSGKNEMDAAIMNGADMSCGAVAGVTRVKNPIQLANDIRQHSEFIFLHGLGAEEYAAERNIELIDPSYFFTQKRWDQFQEALEKDSTSLDHEKPEGKSEGKYGTVGCVALDLEGNLAAATSTGGLVNKKYQRIGDSPLIGAGTYANNESCAVSCTGKGEDFIRYTAASSIASRIQYLKEPADSAAHVVLFDYIKKNKGRGGCIVVLPSGELTFLFTTTGMYRAGIDANGKKTVAIYE
ncbi:MAG: Isoaspartyl peptidase precursor [Bacteroidota bacterium]|jgi:beta-aspartyl-peptidase (threonine type)